MKSCVEIKIDENFISPRNLNTASVKFMYCVCVCVCA